MNWNKFKNNKITSIFGSLFPLLILLYFIFFLDPSIIKLLSVSIFSVFCIVLYIGNIGRFGISNGRSIFPFTQKMIYSKYGTYFLIKNFEDYENGYLSYSVYTNKYFFFLSVIGDKNNIVKFECYGQDIEEFYTKINSHLSYVYNDGHPSLINRYISTIKKWDGITDKSTLRDKTIDGIIKKVI